MILDELKDEDKEVMKQPAEEEILTIPDGPTTRSRTKKIKEAIGGLIKKSLEHEESLGGSLILQDTLTTIQAISPSS
ncbi:hypothetical protein Bca101_006075 [Brassica carinata]